jgi:hypothetical protein
LNGPSEKLWKGLIIGLIIVCVFYMAVALWIALV